MGELVHNSANRRFPRAALHNLDSDGIGFKHTLRRKQDPSALGLAMNEPHAVRQPRLCIERDCYRRFVHRRS
jgi:hypothetical protein